MKNASEHAKKLRGLLRKAKAGPEPGVELPSPIEVLVYAYLLWETTTKQADASYLRLMRQVVDMNDLRVTDTGDLVEMLGDRVSMAEERVLMMRRGLNAVYLSEHAMNLARVSEMGKRDARAYMEGLDGVPRFVSGYVLLHAFGVHAMPVDENLLGRLERDGVVAEGTTIEEAQSFLEHQVKAAEGERVAGQLRGYSESGGGRVTKKTTKKKTTRKKTTKKKTTKKKTTKKKTTKKKTKRS